MVLPELLAPLCEIQVIFPSRRGMLPAVRSFIDFLAAHCVSEVAERQIRSATLKPYHTMDYAPDIMLVCVPMLVSCLDAGAHAVLVCSQSAIHH